ncbi:hypothetical protein [Hwanghaeella sp. LZ110]|uniref:hypothetical protein n=1 Tax=Hwanghaeella sp. LZ110 TaxID=3402810 RepID=UPI003B677757
MHEKLLNLVLEGLDCLNDRKVAVVYVGSFCEGISSVFHLKQRTKVITGYAEALDALKSEAIFFNIDQFIEVVSRYGNNVPFDFVIYVPGGTFNFGATLVIPSLSELIGRPVFPSAANAISLWHNKIAGRAAASHLGWNVAQRFMHSDDIDGESVIRKPIFGGDSFGIEIYKNGKHPTSFDSGEDIIESFIDGYDATIYLARCPFRNEFEVLGGLVTKFDGSEPKKEIWTNDRKLYSSAQYQSKEVLNIERFSVNLATDISSLSAKTCNAFLVDTFARIDVRFQDDIAPEQELALKPSFFLELNPLPTISASGSWFEMIHSKVVKYPTQFARFQQITNNLSPMAYSMVYLLSIWAGRYSLKSKKL